MGKLPKGMDDIPLGGKRQKKGKSKKGRKSSEGTQGSSIFVSG